MRRDPKLYQCRNKNRNCYGTQIHLMKNWKLYGIFTSLLLIQLSWPTLADTKPIGYHSDWRPNYEGHGTTHEQMGQAHWPPVEYTDYEPKPKYSKAVSFSSFGMKTVFNLSHYLLDNILYSDPAIPPGYVVVKGQDSLLLGPKVEMNDWQDLVREYALILCFLFFLLVIIILLPFIAVCYCCFCFCHRCSPGCPPCDKARDLRRCKICSFILVLLLILLILGSLIAFMCNRLLDRGIAESRESLRQGTQDICEFLRDVKEHIHHLFGYNYEELSTHLKDLLTNAHKHIFVDIGDTSEANALEELERILNNMPKALNLMEEVRKLELELRFLGDQLRDALRGMKRDLNDASYALDNNNDFIKVLDNTLFEFIDTSICLHFDELPDTAVYVQGVKEVIQSHVDTIPPVAITRFGNINDVIAAAMEKLAPKLINDIVRGRDLMLMHANRIQEILEAVISDIHLTSLRSTRSFEDFYDKYGIHRTVVNITACILIFVILCVLIVALILGILAKRATAAAFFFIAILLIFCVISFITLVGLFYFVIGIVTYHGGCAPFKDRGASEIFQKLDAAINPKKYGTQLDVNEANPPLRISNAIAACEAHQSIFNLLTEHRIFDINDFTRIRIMSSDSGISSGVQSDLSQAKILTTAEAVQLDAITTRNLSTYHSKHYLNSICKPFTVVSMKDAATRIRKSLNSMPSDKMYIRGRMTGFTVCRYMDKMTNTFITPMNRAYDKLKQTLKSIDQLILYNNLQFGNGIRVLLTSVIRSESFVQVRGKEFINSLIKNLTDFTNLEVDTYIDKIITDCNTKAGLCEPLAYIYFRSVDIICARLVDPINGFWMGLLMCSLLFLPVLFVAHRLMCLFKKQVYLVRRNDIVEFGRTCPVCTGLPYIPPPNIICSGGAQQKVCVCPKGNERNAHRSGGGVIRNDVVVFEDPQRDETYTEEHEDPSFSKRKRD